MKNQLDLDSYGFAEMSSMEMEMVDGGNLWYDAGYAAAIVGHIIYEAYKAM